MSRPKGSVIPLDEKKIEQYAKAGASNREIADSLGVDESVIRRRMVKLLRKARADRKIMVRTWQTQQAQKNPALAIWIGKNELGQCDKQEIKHSGEVTTFTLNIGKTRAMESNDASNDASKSA